jgi:hypothetical protein
MTKKKPEIPPVEEIVAGSWDAMVKLLPHLTEKQLEKLVELEMKGQNRPNWLMERIHPRLMTVRRNRERRELKNKTWEPST